MQEFTSGEKAEAFDRIAALYYNHNFGSATKKQLDTLMFALYEDHAFRAEGGVPDYPAMGRELGLKDSKVRSLREDRELTIPREEYDWVASFFSLVSKARYDERKGTIRVLVDDPNVMRDLRHRLERNSWFDEWSGNAKLFECKPEFFIELCYELDREGQTRQLDESDIHKIKQFERETGLDLQRAIDLIKNGNQKDGLLQLVPALGNRALPFLAKALPVLAETLSPFL